MVEPVSHRTALSEPAWRAVMEAEFEALQANKTWTLVPRPPDTNIVGNKWIFKAKFRPDGSVDKYKARLVARGFTQQYGIVIMILSVLWLNQSQFTWCFLLLSLVMGAFVRSM